MSDKARWCPIMKTVCENEKFACDDGDYECRNCPLDSLRTIADALSIQQKQSTEAMDFSRNFLNKVMPGATDDFPGVKQDPPQPTKWWPDVIVCKNCGAEIVFAEEPKEVEVICPVCSETNLVTAVR